jgi:hypothetical protein
MSRRTCRNNISPKKPKPEIENPMKLEGVLDVDAIPSLIIKKMIPIVVEEKEKSPTKEKM